LYQIIHKMFLFRNKKYKHIYFDIDRTLWDFEANTIETFADLIVKYDLTKKHIDLGPMVESYHKHNEKLWVAYRKGQVKKKALRVKRFELLFADFGIKDENLALQLADDYIAISPTKKILFPHVSETLAYLSKKYKLHIITNGFEEMQSKKLESSGIIQFFTLVVTSDSIGIQKPNAGIFEYALKTVNARKKDSLMIGDDMETDIKGARDFGIDQVFFNTNGLEHSEKVTYEIKSFEELMGIL
jgi:putative hydrolase of the HAD superfamily